MKTLTCLAALLLATPAFAQTPIDESRPLAADGQVSIENLKGRVTVRSWDRNEVRVTGTLGEGVEKLEVDAGSGRLAIRVRYPEQGRGWFGRDDDSGPTLLEVSVPASASVDIEAVSADIDVAGVGGRRLQAGSVSGNVLVRDSRPGEAELESVSGDVDAEIDSTKVRLSAVSGDVRLVGDIGGDVSAESVSGDVRLSSGRVERLSVSTVSGDAQLDTALVDGGRLQVESVSGDLRLTLPVTTSATLQAESFSGRIRSPVGEVQSEDFGPGSHLDTRLGDGKGRISLESFSGNIDITTR